MGPGPRRMRILVIALAGIGDCLIATPLIHELRLHYPEAEIEALVFWPGSKDLLEGNPHLNAIHQKNLIKAGRVQAVRDLLGLGRAALRSDAQRASFRADPLPAGGGADSRAAAAEPPL